MMKNHKDQSKVLEKTHIRPYSFYYCTHQVNRERSPPLRAIIINLFNPMTSIPFIVIKMLKNFLPFFIFDILKQHQTSFVGLDRLYFHRLRSLLSSGDEFHFPIIFIFPYQRWTTRCISKNHCIRLDQFEGAMDSFAVGCGVFCLQVTKVPCDT